MQGKEEEETKRKKRGKEKDNLGAHLSKLEEAGYVEMRKEFAERKAVTWYEITAAGSKRCALIPEHWKRWLIPLPHKPARRTFPRGQ